MDQLTTNAGLAALAAGGVAVMALLLAGFLALRLRRMRRAQTAVLGDGSRDLVAHAAELQEEFRALRDWVDDMASQLERRMGTHVRLPRTVRLLPTDSILARSWIYVARPEDACLFAGRAI